MFKHVIPVILFSACFTQACVCTPPPGPPNDDTSQPADDEDSGSDAPKPDLGGDPKTETPQNEQSK